jgi:hypothetical protein
LTREPARVVRGFALCVALEVRRERVDVDLVAPAERLERVL